MKRLLSLLLQRWVLSLIGCLILSALIWFDSPLLTYDGQAFMASETVRMIVIGLLWAMWVAYWCGRLLVSRRAAGQLKEVLAGSSQNEDQQQGSEVAAATAAEMALLNQRLQEAMQVLRQKHAGSDGKMLYRLPWYMFIGAPGAGKTTALSQSGLNFLLNDVQGKKTISGLAGTRHCDWWFTDEAVMLDTAGRYTTQDSFAEVDNAAWRGFLSLLKKYRQRQPINGVIVAISIADLLDPDAERRNNLALIVRQRIAELHAQLGIRFPIYVMVTKCDLLAGFVDYFDGLTREQSAQVWGVTFPLNESTNDSTPIAQTLASFPKEFRALEAQLQVRVLERLQNERDIARRALIYGFPQQFAAVGDVLTDMLQAMFTFTQFEERALLRGIYFTSGTQEGNPIDRVIASLASAFGLDRQALPANQASGRSFFVTRLLREVVFQEAGLAGLNRRREAQRRFIQIGIVSLFALFLAAVTIARTSSFLGNQAFVQHFDDNIRRAEKMALALPESPTLMAILPLLDTIRIVPAGYAHRDESVSPWMQFGLYQGSRLGPVAIDVYQQLLRNHLQPRLVQRLEEVLRRGEANHVEYLYQALRIYLMLGDRKHADDDAIQAWFDFDFNNNLPQADELQIKNLSAHVHAWLAMSDEQKSAFIEPNQALVKEVRRVVAQTPLAQRLYTRISKEILQSDLTEFSISTAGGPAATLALMRPSGLPLTRGVPGLYTIAGYRQFVSTSERVITEQVLESWVMGRQEEFASPDALSQLRATLRTLYLNEYIRQWNDFVSDIALLPFASLEEGARLTSILAGADSPLRMLVTAIRAETHLDGVRTGAFVADSVLKIVKNKLDVYKNKLEQAMGSADPEPLPAPDKPLNPVDAHFSDLHRAGTPASMTQILLLLKDVAVYFDEADRARKTGTAMPVSEAFNKLKHELRNSPAPISTMLLSMEAKTSDIALGSDKARLNAIWSASGKSFCMKAIAGRYPLVRNAQSDILSEDFSHFFAPEGLLDDFFQKYLLPYVDKSEARWRWRSGAAGSLGMSTAALEDFQRGAMIRAMFFPLGSKQPSLRFQLKQLKLDPELTSATLTIDGQKMEFTPTAANASAHAMSMLFQIPSGKRVEQVQFDVQPAGAKTDLRTEGPWAWLRMLDMGQVEATEQNERLKLRFEFDGRALSLLMTASSVIHPFQRTALEQFHCPENL